MKKFSKFAVCAFVLSFAVSAFAGDGKLVLHQETTVNGSTLKAGDYKVKWDDSGAVSILSGKKVVATASAKVATAEHGSRQSAAVIERQQDGSFKLSEIQFQGKKQSLQLTDGSASGTASGANAQ